MNPFEAFTLVLTGLLILGLVTVFIDKLLSARVSNLNRVDLLNVVNVLERGLSRGAFFNATYQPSLRGRLVVTNESIMINNQSMPYQGLTPVNCSFKSLLLSERGVNCLSQ